MDTVKPSRLSVLKEEAEKRGLASTGAQMSAADVFALVRDMPSQRASTREPEVILREWRGTCSGKHYLLEELFKELGYEIRLVMCTHHFTEENTKHFPMELRAHLADGPVPDVHTFIRLSSGEGWNHIDATWPSSAERLGMPVNRYFAPGVDMKIACDPIEFFEVPAGVQPQTFKEQLIESFCRTESGKRELFIQGLTEWLGDSTT